MENVMMFIDSGSRLELFLAAGLAYSRPRGILCVGWGQGRALLAATPWSQRRNSTHMLWHLPRQPVLCVSIPHVGWVSHLPNCAWQTLGRLLHWEVNRGLGPCHTLILWSWLVPGSDPLAPCWPRARVWRKHANFCLPLQAPAAHGDFAPLLQVISWNGHSPSLNQSSPSWWWLWSLGWHQALWGGGHTVPRRELNVPSQWELPFPRGCGPQESCPPSSFPGLEKTWVSPWSWWRRLPFAKKHKCQARWLLPRTASREGVA